MNQMVFQWIDSPEALVTEVAQWLEQPFIAIDTEFFRERTYFAALGLIQIAGAQGTALIDPLAITNWQELLRPVLLSDQVEKVFHSGEEDLEIFTRALGASLHAVRDSQFMYGLLTAEPGISYIHLVSHRLGVDLEKSQTRSDWLQRPLSDAQCRYAAADVTYLYRLYPTLKQDVETQQRWTWMEQEGDAMATRALAKPADQYYLNLRQGADLRGNRLWLLQQLAQQRELRCQQLDRFRKGLVSDADLVLIARHRPATARELALLVETRPSVLRQEQDWILALVKQSHTVTQAVYPDSIVPSIPRAWATAFKQLKQTLRAVADQHRLPPEYLSRKLHLEAFFWHWVETRHLQIPEAWLGWRWQLFGETVQNALPSEAEALALKGAG